MSPALVLLLLKTLWLKYVAYIEPNLVSLLHPGKNSHNRHPNALQYRHHDLCHTQFSTNCILEWLMQYWLNFSVLVLHCVVLSRFCFQMSPQIISEEEVFILMTKSLLPNFATLQGNLSLSPNFFSFTFTFMMVEIQRVHLISRWQIATLWQVGIGCIFEKYMIAQLPEMYH